MICEKNRIYWILAFGLLLRVIGLGFGLPEIYHQDEPIIINHAMAIGVGGWNLHFFVIPPFVTYFLFFIFGLVFFIGKLCGIFASASEFGLFFVRDASLFYLIGRFFVGVLFGTMTIWALWRLAKRFFSTQVAFWSAILLAVIPFHNQHSHYIYVDVPLTLATTLLLHELLNITNRPILSTYVRFGALLGWAIAIKYTAFYFVGVFVLLHMWLEKENLFKKTSIQKILVSGFSCVLIFAVIAPFTFLDFQSFYQQIVSQTGAESFTGWGHHLIYSLIGGSGWVILGFFIIGVWGIFRFYPKRYGIVIAGFGMTFYFVNAVFGQSFARYMLPLVPIWVLLAALGIEFLFKNLSIPKIIPRLLISILLVELLTTTAYTDWLFVKKDTRTECADWFISQVDSGSVVVLDNKFFGPRLLQTAEQIKDKFNLLNGQTANQAKAIRLKYSLEALKGKKTFNVYQLAAFDQRSTAFLFSRPFVDLKLEDLRSIQAKYLVVNYADSNAGVQPFIDSIKDQLVLEKSFSPYRNILKKRSVDPHDLTAAPHLASELYSRRSLGPYIEIYKIKQAA